MNIGFKHFTGLQWFGVASFLSLVFMLLSVFVLDIKVFGWSVALVANVVLVFFSIFFIKWPGKDGFKVTEDGQ